MYHSKILHCVKCISLCVWTELLCGTVDVKIFVFVDVVNIVSIQYYIVYTVQCQHAMFLGCCIKVIYELNIKL